MDNKVQLYFPYTSSMNSANRYNKQEVILMIFSILMCCLKCDILFSQLGHIKAVQDNLLVNGDTLIVESRRATAMYFPSGLIRTHRTSSAIRNVLVFRKLSCLLPGCHLVHKGVSKDRKDKNYAGTPATSTRLHVKFYLKIVTTYKRKKLPER